MICLYAERVGVGHLGGVCLDVEGMQGPRAVEVDEGVVALHTIG